MTRTPLLWPTFIARQPPSDCPSLSDALGSWDGPPDPDTEDFAGPIAAAYAALVALLTDATRRGGAAVSDAAEAALILLDGFPCFEIAQNRDDE